MTGGAASTPPPGDSPGDIVARILAVLPDASTSPALAETGDGARWVLKFSGAGPGPFGLLTEYLALAVSAAFGAPVPAARPLWLPPGFPWMAGTDEFDAMVQRSPGWNLGIGWLEGARAATAEDLAAAPVADLDAIARADCYLQNVDRMAQNPNLLAAGGRLYAIDYDATLYLSRAIGPDRPASTALPRGHILAGRPRPKMERTPLIDFPALTAAAPAEWVGTTGLSAPALAVRLTASLAAWVAATES